MTHQPQIQPRAAQPYAGIPATVTMDTISTAVDSAFPELFGWLASQGIAPAGPPFIRYLVIDMAGDLQIELGVPVSAPVAGRPIRPGCSGRQLRGTPAHRPVRRPGGQQRRAAAVGAGHDVRFDTRETGQGSAWVAGSSTISPTRPSSPTRPPGRPTSPT